jgi:hypothetical protein
LDRRTDALFDLTDAILTADAAVPSPAHLSLQPPHRRGWGSLYAALSHGRIGEEALRKLLARHPLAESGATPVYAVDVSVWPRCDAEASPEHAILERAIKMLGDGGKLGLILPDGVFNNQGELSNCPRVRRYPMKNGVVEAIVSLPDYAFRKSGAQNKTSILFFRKFTGSVRARFQDSYNEVLASSEDEDEAVLAGLRTLGRRTFLAEANFIGYTPAGAKSHHNDLYNGSEGGRLNAD